MFHSQTKIIARKCLVLALLVLLSCMRLPAFVEAKATPKPAALQDAINAQSEVVKTSRMLQEQIQLYRESDVKVRDFTEKLKPIEQQIGTLTDQLALMDEQIRITSYKAASVMEDMEETTNAIAVTTNDLNETRVKVRNQANVLFEYIKLIYAHKKQYYDPETKALSELKLLLASSTLSQTVSAGQSLEIVERAGQKILRDLEIVSKELDAKQAKLAQEESELAAQQQDLLEQQTTLLASQRAKQKLLEQTKGDEAKYQKMIREAQAQRDQASEEVTGLQKELAIMSNAAAKLRATVSIDLRGLSRKGAEAAKALEEGEKQRLFQWPVSPQRGISAYFIDPGYLETFGVQHNALDIPIPQGTLVQAPADSVVYKAKDNGFGFSYIILIHRNGFATLYGHLSGISVKEGDVVKTGGIIGLSGGAPGTLGAGLRTTGAHLHWEVIKDGVRVDPLRYVELDPVRNLIPTSRLPEVQGSLMEK